jgi:hypothetical protein
MKFQVFSNLHRDVLPINWAIADCIPRVQKLTATSGTTSNDNSEDEA